ncbi:ATP-binding cassette domain-containing protein [Acidianus sulfidivorans JP7]|uniref:Iron ABC transporter ATP-binding protein n=1 Tax=Acidianus sulfidivorans JP7 TaxID=619593 RepID=A0A2U9IL49_9CREN|nr:ABC transporter ATP-binding protein [Acidianus sulfidivorans]AWR96740.1 ATP-binding cassette domain-containing protein [Acidianus sulfidivorans JP7]
MLIKNINVKIRGKDILSEISFEVKNGINVILGPNGSGKTTLIRSIIGMIKPIDGEIKIQGSEKISYVPSEFFPAQMKVKDVLLSGNNRKSRIEEYLDYAKTLGIIQFLDRDFSTLSSGEKRLTLVCKALVEGNIVIMDEPLSNLDISNKHKILTLMLDLSKNGKTFLITSHELEVIDYASQLIILKKGKIVYLGDPKKVNEEILSDVYDVKVKKYSIEDKLFFKTEE